MLSVSHLIAPEGIAKVGDPIIHPETLAFDDPRGVVVATLVDSVHPQSDSANTVDVAIAAVLEDIPIEPADISGMGLGTLRGVYPGVAANLIGKPVRKLGVGSGITQGIVQEVGVRMSLAYASGDILSETLIRIESPGSQPFLEPGDSGALVVDDEGYAIGILIAGNDPTDPNQASVGLAIPIQAELEALGLELVLDIRPAEAQDREPDFPPLQTLTFETGQLVEAPDTDTPTFPPLQTETFDVVTIEFEGPTDTNPIPDVELVSFTFEVATLERDSQSRQWTTQRQQQQAQGYREPLAKNVLIDMVAIPGGRFVMRSPKDELKRPNRENPQHDVTVPAFFMGRYPITQAQWRAVAAMPAVHQDLNPDPARFKGDPRRPVERINWYEAIEFCNRLAAHTGRPYRLPSEAEWEYACRAGTTTPFHFGRTIMATLANYQGTVLYSNEPVGENRKKTTPVGHFGVANAFGLSDMHGNVREWCLDLWHSDYNGAPTDGSAWIEARHISERVVRGGSWSAEPRFCRSASREGHGVVIRSNIGLRVVWSPP